MIFFWVAGRLEENVDDAALYRRWSLVPLARLLQYCFTFYCINDILSGLTDFLKKINCYYSQDNLKEWLAVP